MTPRMMPLRQSYVRDCWQKAGLWSRGYDVAFTRRRSQVQFLPSPPLTMSSTSDDAPIRSLLPQNDSSSTQPYQPLRILPLEIPPDNLAAGAPSNERQCLLTPVRKYLGMLFRAGATLSLHPTTHVDHASRLVGTRISEELGQPVRSDLPRFHCPTHPWDFLESVMKSQKSRFYALDGASVVQAGPDPSDAAVALQAAHPAVSGLLQEDLLRFSSASLHVTFIIDLHPESACGSRSRWSRACRTEFPTSRCSYLCCL